MEHARTSEHEHHEPLLDERENEGRQSQEDDIELDELHDGFGPSSVSDSAPLTSFDTPIPAVPRSKSSYLAIAAVFVVTVAGFTINTEATAYFEDVLGWKKPFTTMYISHSSLCLPWLGQLAYSRWKNRETPYVKWVREYNNQIREAVATIDAYATSGPSLVFKRKGQVAGPLDFLASTMAVVTVVLTVSGGAWFVSLVFTTPADLTAIYNTSTFFAAAFSVPILKERLGWLAIIAVALSVAGTFIIAYGDTTAEHESSAIGTARLLGNLIACGGAVAFGLYEVLFKKWACSSRPMKPSETLPLTFAASALTGIYTFATLWVGIIILHFTGIEEFVVPSAWVSLWIFIAVISLSSES